MLIFSKIADKYNSSRYEIRFVFALYRSMYVCVLEVFIRRAFALAANSHLKRDVLGSSFEGHISLSFSAHVFIPDVSYRLLRFVQ